MKSLSDLWDSILARLSGELSDTTIKTWFDEISVVTMEDSALVLHCSNAFKKNTVEARFLPQIKAALKDIFSTDMEVKILNDQQLAAYHGVAPDRPGDLFDSDVYEALELKHCVHERKVYGGPSKDDVTRQIQYIKDFVAVHR